MAGKLHPVSQSFDADSSGYLAAMREMIGANIGFGESIDNEVIAKIGEIGRAMQALPDSKSIRITADAGQALGEIGRIGAALDALGDREVTVRVRYVTEGSPPDASAGIGTGLPAGAGDSGMSAMMLREARDSSASLDMLSSTMGRVEQHLAAMRQDAADSSADLMQQTQMMRDQSTAAAAMITAASAARGGGDSGNAALLAAAAAASGGGSGGGGLGAAAGLAAALAGGGGAGGGGGAAALAAAAGGGGGGGGGAVNAATTFANVANWVRRVYPFVHWAMMATNEVLATAGPAAVALGAAGLVGYQGGQQLYNRYQALNTVGESLGPSTGQSMATFLHVPGTLQQLQNQYGSGEMYGIAGAGINALRTGGGDAVLQLGQNTLSMLSGAAADFVLAMKGGLGQAAGQIVAGGTQYAQQFGDVLGNVGKTFMNVSPNLPGVGSMLLTLLQSGTGGLADATKALGPGLLPVLGYEAGARYGPTIVGGAATALGKLPFGLGGTVGTAAVKATAADVAAGKAAAVGDILTPGTGAGLAGFLGAMTAPEIGALAVATIAITKGLTGHTAAQQQYAGLASGMTLQNMTGNLGQIATGAMPGGVLPAVQPGVWWKGGSRGAFGNVGVLGGGAAEFGKSFLNDQAQGVGLVADLFTGRWSQALHNVGSMWQDLTGPSGMIHGLGQMLGIVGPPPDPAQAAMQQLGTAFSTWSNVLGSAGQVKDIWKGMGSGALSTAQALDVMAQSGVNVTTAFGKGGQFTAKASQQIQDYVAGYQAMTGTVPGGASGGTLATINAVGVAGGLQASKLTQTNAALDQIVQIASGGAAGTAALTTLLAAVPAGAKGAPAPLATGVLTPGGAAAMTAFASTTQPSVISQLQQNMDWMRTAQVLGAFGGSGATQTGMAKFLIGQAFRAPGVAQTPMALAQLSAVAQPYGMAPLAPGESAKQYDAAFKTFLQGADSAKQYARNLTTTTEKVSSIPADYKQFVTTASGGAQSGLANAINLFGQSVQNQFMASFAKGGPSAGMEKQYANILAAAGFKPGAAGDVAGYAAKVGGATPSQIQQVIHGVIKWTNQYETPHPPAAANPPPVKYPSTVAKPVPPPPTPGGRVQYSSAVTRPIPPAPPAGGTVVYHSVVIGPSGNLGGLGGHTGSGMQTGFKIPGYGGGDIWGPAMLEPGELIVPKHMVASGAVDHLRGKIPGFAAGGVADPSVPYFSSMGVDFRVALQSVAGELAAELQQAVSLSAGGMHGAASFGSPLLTGSMLAPGGVTRGTTASPVAVHVASVAPAVAAVSGGGFPGAPGPMPAAANKVIDAFEQTFKNMPGPWSQVASEILNGLLAGVKNSTKETAAMAQALVSKVQTEIAFGRGVTNTAVSGLNFPGMQVATPTMTAQGKPYQYYIDQQNMAAGGQPGSVQEQMGSYLQAMQSFQGDMGKLAKGGLEKRLLSQLFAAGPIQGDAEAQSILGGAGGAKGANKLYDQINSLATKLGVSAIGDVYGMPAGHAAHGAAGKQVVLQAKPVHVPVTANTAAAQAAINAIHGKSVTVDVNLNITSSGGGGAVDLSPAQIKSIASQVQSKLLSQAKQNRRTGTTLPGYGS